MNQNLSLFAKLAAPGRPNSPDRPAISPVALQAAAAGRGGDNMVAHMTPGEIAVPPEVQTPEVLAALNRAFAARGANPTSYQAGNPDQKVNPETGLPEFGFFDMLLPLTLGLAGSAFGGPLLGGGVLGGMAGGAIGTTAGNLITGKPLGQALAMGAGSALGSGIGGALMSGANTLGDVVNNFGGGSAPASGGGAAPMAQVGPNAVSALNSATDTTGPTDLVSRTTTPLSGSALSSSAMANPSVVAAAANPSWGDKLLGALGMDTPLKTLAGRALGGAIGSSIGASMFPPKAIKPDLGPPMTPLSQLPPLSSRIGGGSPAISGPINAGPATFPAPGYRPGIDPQFNYFPAY